MIPVLFINYADDAEHHRGAWWDQTIVEWMLAHSRHDLSIHEGTWKGVPDSDGIVIVTPGHYGEDGIERLNRRLTRYRWVLLIVTSNEEDDFPWWNIKAPNGRIVVWRQHPTKHRPDRVLPLGPPPHAIDWEPDGTPKTLDWFLSCQVTHERRQECVRALKAIGGGELHETDRFLGGMNIGRYMAKMESAKVCPAPSGPHTPDTFRLYEALETGAVPIVDVGALPLQVQWDYWRGLTFYTPPPFPIVDGSWSDVTADALRNPLPELRIVCESWWQLEKRNLARRFDADIADLSGIQVDDVPTTVVTTSPIPSHPDSAITLETVESILARTDGDIIIAADGVRPEQEHMRADYLAYLADILHRTRTEWNGRVWVSYDGVWRHQAGTTAQALRHVWTVTLLFAEHDTPLVGDVRPDRIARQALSLFDVVRFHHEASILAAHQHLNVGEPVTIGAVRFQPTRQWSQRPHIARTDTYRRILAEFPSTSRTMIEDKLYGLALGRPWEWLRIAIYTPDGDIKRSGHLDGREGEPKFDMVFG